MLNLNFTPFPVIGTEHLILREITEEDMNEIFVFRSHPDIMKHIDRAPATSVDEAKIFIDKISDTLHSGDGICWGISLKDNPKLIGTVAIWRIDREHHRGEIGYVLHPDHQGRGIMHEALKAIIGYGFNAIKLHSLEANINPDNNASGKVLEGNGFTKEAHFKENYFYDGRYLDSAIYSLLSPL